MKPNIPTWIERGPLDLEYKTYKLFQRLKELETMIPLSLMEALFEIDDTLDYLYRYDAIKQTELEPSIEFIGFPMDNLELVFSTEEELETNNIVDLLYEESIDKFEALHEKCRQEWRFIDSGIDCSYIGSKKHFLAGGFVFISTPDSKIHCYFFNKPSKNFNFSWKDFKMEHITTKDYDENDYFKTLTELEDAKSDRLLIKVNLKTHTKIEGHAITVINNMIFTMLQRDYSF